MKQSDNLEEAIEVLKQLGLKEYEARCFVGLSRIESGTAKQLSELTEVPRTRVYDAIRMLEANGLVEIQHTSPQRFRAVPLSEASETFREQYVQRVDRLQNTLSNLEVIETEEETDLQEVWSMNGQQAIENRADELIADATDEVVLVIGEESLLTEKLIDRLNGIGNGVDLVVGALSESVEDDIEEKIPAATTFISGLDWLQSEDESEHEVAIGRLLMIDGSTILVSSVIPESGEEQAVFGDGFDNGLVVIARRLMSQGLMAAQDPTI